jgi:hypothetical protein
MMSLSASSSKLCATGTPSPWEGRARALCAEGGEKPRAPAAVPS